MKGIPIVPFTLRMQVTANKTRVLDPLIDAGSQEEPRSVVELPPPPVPDVPLPMVMICRGLGPESGAAYAWDNPDWLVRQIIQAVPQDVLNKVIFAVLDSYTSDLKQSLQQATELIDARKGKISSYSLCGFSKGGGMVYKNKSLKDWKILGLIDPEPPSSSSIVDSVAGKIRCVYNVNNWSPKIYGDSVKNFHDYLKKLNVKMEDGTVPHNEMPALFFKTYGKAFTQ